MFAINELFALSEPHVLSFFKEDVRNFLEQHEIQKFQDFKLAGKSGFDHKFDFALPKTRNQPERVLEAVNLLSKDQAISLAWAVSDVKAIREEPLDVLVFINDIINPPTPDNVSALQAYDIKTSLWSEREQALPLLNGRDTAPSGWQHSLPTEAHSPLSYYVPLRRSASFATWRDP